MSKEKPKSAMAALLEQSQGKQQNIQADIGVAMREPEIDSQTILPAEQIPVQTSGQYIEVDPEDCCLWKFADRPDEELGDLSSLALSMQEHGQQEPILVRVNTQSTKHRYEIIFGNRRWRAAKLAGIRLKAIFRELSDQKAAICQKEENENRQALSDYARAQGYTAQINAGVFKNELELSAVLGISKNTLNDIMAFVRVPEILRSAIPNYRYLSRVTAVRLAQLAKDKNMLKILLGLAALIGQKTITAANIDRYIALKTEKTPNQTISGLQKFTTKVAQVSIQLIPLKSGDISVQVKGKLPNHKDLNQWKEKLLKVFGNTQQKN